MAATELKIIGVERTEFGKGPSRRARRAGNVPAVLYGNDFEPVHLDLPGHEVFLIVKDSANAVVNVEYGKNTQLALVKAIQRHPVRRDILHVDLQVVRAGEKVEVEVPLMIVGEIAPGTQMQQEEFALLISVPATSIPEHIEINVEGLTEGTHIRVADVKLPEGAEALYEPERVIITVTAVQEISEESAEGTAESSTESVSDANA